MVKLMKPLVQRYGLTASREVPTDTTLSQWHQEALRVTMTELDVEIALVLGTALPATRRPDTSTRLYQLSYAIAGDEFATTWQSDPIIRYQFMERRKLPLQAIDEFARTAMHPATPRSPTDEFTVDYQQLDAMIQRYANFTVPIYASNAAFELLVLTERFDELQTIVETIRERVGVFLLGTHYAGVIIPLVEEAGIDVDGYLTPVNAAGIYMFPTQRHVVEAIRTATKPVIAIKPLGGGRVPPHQAFRYLFQELNIPAAMVGIGSLAEADETFSAAAEALKLAG